MKVYIFSKPSDEPSEELELLLAQLTERNIPFQLINPEAQQYSGLSQALGILSTPSVVVTQDDETSVHDWQHHLPSADQVEYALGKI